MNLGFTLAESQALLKSEGVLRERRSEIFSKAAGQLPAHREDLRLLAREEAFLAAAYRSKSGVLCEVPDMRQTAAARAALNTARETNPKVEGVFRKIAAADKAEVTVFSVLNPRIALKKAVRSAARTLVRKATDKVLAGIGLG